MTQHLATSRLLWLKSFAAILFFLTSSAHAAVTITLADELRGTFEYDQTTDAVTNIALQIPNLQGYIEDTDKVIEPVLFDSFQVDGTFVRFISDVTNDEEEVVQFVDVYIRHSFLDGVIAAGTDDLSPNIGFQLDDFATGDSFNESFSFDEDITFTVQSNQAAAAPVPEPSTYAMMSLGLLGIAGMRRRKHQA